jgi:hypothetical protein
MNRHRHLFLLLLVALILASVAIALAGWWAVEEQEKADAQRAKIFKDQFAEEVRGFVLNYLNGIVLKLRELPREAVLPGGIDRLEQIRDELVSREQWIEDDYPNSAVAVVGWVDGARLVFPSDPVSLETRAKAVKRSIENPDFIERKREADLADIRKNYEEEITIFRAMSRVSDPNQRNLARFLLAGALMRAGRTREGIDLYTDLLKLPSYVVDEFGDPLVKHVIDALLGQDSPDLERAILDRISQETDSPAALSRSEQFLGPIVEKLARVRARDPEVGRDVARTSELFVKQTKKLERVRSWPEARAMQESFEEKPLGDSSEADQKDSNKALDVNSDWRARTFASEEIWLVRKISTRSEPSLVVAVRADQIQRVFETRRRKDFENERIQLLSFVKCKPGKSVYVGLPGLCFQARAARRGVIVDHAVVVRGVSRIRRDRRTRRPMVALARHAAGSVSGGIALAIRFQRFARVEDTARGNPDVCRNAANPGNRWAEACPVSRNHRQ